MSTLLVLLFLSLVGHSFQGTLLTEDVDNDDDVDIDDEYGDVDEAGDDEAKEYSDNSGNVGNEMSRKVKGDPWLYPVEELERLRQMGIDDNTTIVEYTAKVYYTLDVAEKYEDIDFFMEQAEAMVNAGYINSNIPVRLRIFCIQKVNLRSTEEFVIPKIKRMNGGDGKNVTALRGSADVVVIIVIRMLGKKYAGFANLDSWRTGNTLACIQHRGPFGVGLSHELGHVFGCAHDVPKKPITTGGIRTVYPYRGGGNFGYNETRGYGYQTIMGPSFDKKKRLNVMYYSGPDIYYKNTGYVTGSDLRDNARVIRENRFAMAAVGDESGTCDWKRKESPVVAGSCRVNDVVYEGINTERAFHTLTAEACETSCKEKKGCDNWTWFNPKKSKKPPQKCTLNNTLRYATAAEGAVSGQLSMC